MAKKYELLKDLPSVKKGSIYEKCTFSDWYQTEGEEWDDCVPATIIENKDWFREVEEVVEKEFVWDDELVEEYACEMVYRSPDRRTMEQFKESKSNSIPSGKGTANDVLNTEKEWEVASIRSGQGVVLVGGPSAFQYREGDIIYSVKRLSDNEIFSVGDKVELPFLLETKILSFYTSGDNKDKMKVACGVYNSEEDYCSIGLIRKLTTAKENYYNDLRDADKWSDYRGLRVKTPVVDNPYKKRTEVTGFNIGRQYTAPVDKYQYWLTVSNPINDEEFPEIKMAIEKIINHE